MTDFNATRRGLIAGAGASFALACTQHVNCMATASAHMMTAGTWRHTGGLPKIGAGPKDSARDDGQSLRGAEQAIRTASVRLLSKGYIVGASMSMGSAMARYTARLSMSHVMSTCGAHTKIILGMMPSTTATSAHTRVRLRSGLQHEHGHGL